MVTALEIFRRLIDDPDYQAQGDKSREEVVWDEAKQRERQSKNNNRALSLAWTDSPSMKSFIEYLEKADDDEEVDEGSQPIKETTLEGVDAGHYKQETPFTKLSTAIGDHQSDKEGLPIYGHNVIAPLRTLAGTHMEAIGNLASKKLVNPPQNEQLINNRKAIQAKHTPKDQLDEENLSGAYNHEIMSRMFARYADIEQDLREVTESLAGRGRWRLGHSDLTKDADAFVPSATYSKADYLLQKRDDLNTVRLSLLTDLSAYIPTRNELTDPEGANGYLASLDKDLQVAGMYGQQWVPSRLLGGSTRNLDNFPFEDTEAMEKLVNQRVISQEEVDGLINLEEHNQAALAQHSRLFGPNIPINTQFDPQRGILQSERDEATSDQLKAAQSWDRLTKHHPNPAMGRRNLYKLLDKAVKTSDSAPLEQGFFNLPEEARTTLNSLDESMRTRFFDIMLGKLDGEVKTNTSSLLNPDHTEESQILPLLRDLANVQVAERAETSDRGREKAFDRIQSREETTLTQDQWDAIKGEDGLSKLVQDLGGRINPTLLNRDALATLDDEWWKKVYNDEHQVAPFSPLGQPIPGINISADPSEPLEGEEPTPNQQLFILKTTAQTEHKRLNDERETIQQEEKKLQQNNIEHLQQEFNDRHGQYERDFILYQQSVGDEIANLESETTSPQINVSNPAIREARTALRREAVDLLRRRGVTDPTREQVSELLVDPRFQRNALDGKTLEEIPKQVQVDQYTEEEFAERQEQNAERVKELTDVLQDDLNEDGTRHYSKEYRDARGTYSEELNYWMNTFLSSQSFEEDELDKQIETLNTETRAKERELSTDIFKQQRTEHFNEIVTYAEGNGVTLRRAADQLKHTLTPLELEFLNSMDNDARLVHNISIGGDMGNALHGRGSLPDEPSLVLHTEGQNVDDKQLQQLIEESPVYQVLKALKINVQINPTTEASGKSIPVPSLHTVDIYNPENAWRNVNSYKSTQVAYPDTSRLPSSIQTLIKRGNLGEEFSFARLWDEGFDKIKVGDKEELYRLIDNVRPTYSQTIDEGAGYHLRDTDHGDSLTAADNRKDAVDEHNHHGWVVERLENGKSRTNTKDPTGRRRRVYRESEIQSELMDKYIQLYPDAEMPPRENFDPDTLLKTDEEDLSDEMASLLPFFVEADADHRPIRTPEGVQNIDKNGRMSREEDAEVTAIGSDAEDMTQAQSDDRAKRIRAVRNWATTLHANHFSTVINPLQGSLQPKYATGNVIIPDTWEYGNKLSFRGKSIHELLSNIPLSVHKEIFKHLNVRDRDIIVGQAEEPSEIDREDSEGIHQVNVLKQAYDADGKALRDKYTEIPKYIEQEIPESHQVRFDSPTTRVRNPETYQGRWESTNRSLEQLFTSAYGDRESYQKRTTTSDTPFLATRVNEDGEVERYKFDIVENKRIHDVKMNKTAYIKGFGVGVEDEYEGTTGQLEQYLHNVLRLSLDTRVNLDRDKRQREREANIKQQVVEGKYVGREREQQLTDESGLPNTVIDNFHDLMQQWFKVKDASKYRVPDELKEFIDTNLPEFSVSGAGGRESFLEGFLANVYRQFSKWTDDQRQITLDEGIDETTLDEMHDEILTRINRTNNARRDTRAKYQKEVEELEGKDSLNDEEQESLEYLQRRLEDIQVFEDRAGRRRNVTQAGLDTESEAFRRFPPWLQESIKDAKDEIESAAVEEAQGETLITNGKNQLDKMFSISSRKASVRFTEEDINHPEGATYIPMHTFGEKAGQIDIDDNGLANVDALPMEILLPPERFTTRSSVEIDMGKLQDENAPSFMMRIPSAYWWLRDPNIGPLFKAIAEEQGITLEDLLSDASASIFNTNGNVEVGNINGWLAHHGFIHGEGRGKDTFMKDRGHAISLPAHLVANENLNYDTPNLIDGSPDPSFIDDIQSSKINAVRTIITNHIKNRERMAGIIPTETGISTEEPMVDYGVDNLSVSQIGRSDQQLQEVLANIFLANPEGMRDVTGRTSQERLLENVVRNLQMSVNPELVGEEFYEPSIKRDEDTGESYFDLGVINQESQQHDLVDLHKRLTNFMQYFEYTSLPTSTVYGERHAGGRKAFRVRDPNHVPLHWHLPENRHYLEDLKELREILMESSGDFVLYDDNPIFYVDRRHFSERDPSIVTGHVETQEADDNADIDEAMNWVNILNEVRETLAQEDLSPEVKKELREQIESLKANQQYSLFNFIDSIFQGQEMLGDLARAQGIELPHLSARESSRVQLDESDFAESLKSLGEQPLGDAPSLDELREYAPKDYFQAEATILPPPMTHEDVAVQHAMLTQWLADNEGRLNLNEHTDATGYLLNLLDYMSTFNIPNILDIEQIQLGDGVEEYFGTQPRVFANGRFSLWTPTGGINSETQGILNQFFTKREGDDPHFTSDMLPDFVKADGTTEPIEILPVDSTQPINIQKDIREVVLPALYKLRESLPEDNTFKDTLDNLYTINETTGAEELNMGAVRDLFGGYFTKHGTTDRDSLKTGEMRKDGTRPEGSLGIKHWLQDQWENLFKDGINPPDRYGRGSDYNWSQLIGIVNKINEYGQSIIDGERKWGEVPIEQEQPSSTEEQEDMALIDGFIDKLAQGQIEPSVLRDMLDMVGKQLDPDDYAKILETNKNIPHSEWEQFTNFSDHYKTLDDDQKALYNPSTDDDVDPSVTVEPTGGPTGGPESGGIVDQTGEDTSITSDEYNQAYADRNQRNMDEQRDREQRRGTSATDDSSLISEFKHNDDHQTGLGIYTKYRRAVSDFNKRVNDEGKPVNIKQETLDGYMRKVTSLAREFDAWNQISENGEEGGGLKITLPTISGHVDYAGGTKGGGFIPSWLTPIEEEQIESDPNSVGLRMNIPNEEKVAWLNESGWQPTLNQADAKQFDGLYFGTNEEGSTDAAGNPKPQFATYHNPTDEEIQDKNLVKLFDVSKKFGYPHSATSSGEGGQPNEEYMKLSEAFRQRQIDAFKDNPDVPENYAETVYNAFQTYFRDFISLNMQNDEVKNWWDTNLDENMRNEILNDIDTEIINDDGSPRINFGHRRIDFGHIALNEIMSSHLDEPTAADGQLPNIFTELTADERTVSGVIQSVLGPEEENIYASPVPETHFVRRNKTTGVEEGFVNRGALDHPGSEASGGRVTPKALLLHGKDLSRRYYHLLDSLMDEEAINKLGEMGIAREELAPPVWDRQREIYVNEETKEPFTSEEWGYIKGFLGKPDISEAGGMESRDIPGIDKLRTNSPFKERVFDPQGRAIETSDVVTWDFQLESIENYIGALQKAYNAVAEQFPNYPIDGVPISQHIWDEQIGAPVIADKSGFTVSNPMYSHLVDLGLVDSGLYAKNTNKRHDVPLTDIRSDTNPEGLFPEDLFTEGKLNKPISTVDKDKIKAWAKEIYETDPSRFTEGKYEEHYVTPTEIPTPIETEPKIDGEQNPLTPEERQGLSAPDMKWLPKDLDQKTPDEWRDILERGEGRPADFDKEPPRGGIIGGIEGEEEDPQAQERKEWIAQIRRPNDDNFGFGNPDLADLLENNPHIPHDQVKKFFNEHLAIAATDIAGGGKGEVDGAKRQRLIAEIQTARESLGHAPFSDAELRGLTTGKKLDAAHEDTMKGVAERDREDFIKQANNPTIEPLDEAALGNKNSLLNQWRRLNFHTNKYSKDMTDETRVGMEEMRKQTYQALQTLVEDDPEANAEQILLDDRKPFILEGATDGDVKLQAVDDVEYGSEKHIQAKHEEAMVEFEKHQAWANYLRGADGVPEEVQHPNRGANTFLHVSDDTERFDGTPVLTSYEMLEAGSRMTTPSRNFLGKEKGDLVFSNEDPAHQGGMFIRGGGYSQISEGDQPHPEGLHDVSPTFDNMVKPPKVFGLPAKYDDEQGNSIDVEEAYGALHEYRVRAKEVMRLLYGEDTDRTLEDWGTKRMPRRNSFTEEEQTEEWSEHYPGENPFEVLEELQREHGEALGVLNQAVADNKIHQETLDVLNGSAGYDRMNARNAFLENHTPEGLPKNANGEVEDIPQYIDASGKLRNRVYHRATKMWYDPEMLDDLRNRGQGSIGTILSSPYDALNVKGLALGEKWKDAVDSETGESIADRYRLAVPASNNDFFDPETNLPYADRHHGIIISPTGVHKVSKPSELTDIPTLDADGKLDHDPYTPDQIAESAFELARLNSEMTNPNKYVDEQGEPKNMVSLDDDGYFDGGWKEWWNAGGKLGLLEMPGVRNIYGARQWDRFVRGKPIDRIKPSDNINVQSSAGRQVWDDLGGTPINEPAPKSRAEKLRNKEELYPPPPPTMRQNRLRAAFDRVQISLNQIGLRSLTSEDGKPRISAISQLNQFLAGEDESTQQWKRLQEAMRTQAVEYGVSPEEVETWISAQNAKYQMEGDPRAVSAYEEGGAEYVRNKPPKDQTIQTQQPPPDQQLVDPTQQQGGDVLYGPQGQVFPPDPKLLQEQSQLEMPGEQV